MERLVNDLLRLARLDAGQETIELVPCDVDAIVRGVVTDFDAVTRKKHQDVRIDVGVSADEVITDPAKLHDIIRNLVENAVHYTPERGCIEIACHVLDGQLRVTVADTGPGILDEHLLRVFERFYRVDKSRAAAGGTGLGLAIVKHLVLRLDGDVRAGNRETGGAIFTVTLPLREELRHPNSG
jgi:two-component system phosphate regulon sensor histidine kinase PhoR